MSVTQRGEVPETTDPEKWERESIRREAYGNAYAPGRGQKVMLLKAELGAVRPQAPGFSPPPWPLHLLLAMVGVSVRGTRSITAEWWRSAAGSPGGGKTCPAGASGTLGIPGWWKHQRQKRRELLSQEINPEINHQERSQFPPPPKKLLEMEDACHLELGEKDE